MPVSGTRSPYRGEASIGIGILIAVLGGLGMLLESNDHTVCGSVLVQATAQAHCSTVNLIWTAGLIGLVLGVALIIAGAIMRSRS
jgi:hypothetical protein